MRTTPGMPRWSCWAAAAPHAGTSSASSSGDLLPRRSLRLRSAANRFADSAQLHVALYDSLHRIGPGPREIHGHVAPAAPGIGCALRATPASTWHNHSRADVESFFAGLELVGPGVAEAGVDARANHETPRRPRAGRGRAQAAA